MAVAKMGPCGRVRRCKGATGRLSEGYEALSGSESEDEDGQSGRVKRREPRAFKRDGRPLRHPKRKVSAKNRLYAAACFG